MKYSNIDEILVNAQSLLKLAGEPFGVGRALMSPILVELVDPMARFSCNPSLRGLVAKSVANSLYLLSGMDGADFIWEFNEWDSPLTVKNQQDKKALGPLLRFQGHSENVLDYHRSNALRQKGTGYTDQLANTINAFKKGNVDTIIQFSSGQHLLPIHSAWFRIVKEGLEMAVTTGHIGCMELFHEVVSPFCFIHQIISDIVGIPLGSSRFVIGCLFTHESKLTDYTKSKLREITMSNFQYPKGGLELRDIDTLMSIMIEFVSRLDENSLGRANPFQGDSRVQMWSDFAEVFRAWKAEKVGYKIMMEQNFYHPQLRLIYKGEVS